MNGLIWRLLAPLDVRYSCRKCSGAEGLQQVKALPPRERRKFFDCVHELKTEVEVQPFARRKRRVRWPDAAARRRRIFGDKVLPNLVLLAREQERY